ncbi:hypothetical protein BD626DRAFT_564316 [Schizophyllum amplum]|uniref:SWIM-type domain-containing protein n=1 Tax=Schizophyllum amplum TaxID=97359 RepID=A0A550CRG5_9AGAR|nr:hypothetical protein BD626DRAFT_564316 [Auriculariopsis ampla]
MPQDDELDEINGIKPKVVMADGDEQEVSSQSSNSTYKVKRTWDHYYCTCPAWRNQGGAPTNARTCKHLKALLGEEYELARLKLKNPYGQQPKPSSSKGKKRKKADDDDDADADDKPASKKSKPASSKLKAPFKEVLLANKWDLDDGLDPTGWWMSEKLDGVRVYYDGERMWSRLGNLFTPPQWFLDKLPKNVHLDGELFGGRGTFQSTVSIVKTINSPHWKNITFQVFDIPSLASQPFEDRLDALKKLVGKRGGSQRSRQVVLVWHEKVRDRQHVLDHLKHIEQLGGEGVMLRKPGSAYEFKRSGTLLKVKTFYDAEALVTGYLPGKGKHKGATGALKCKMASGSVS